MIVVASRAGDSVVIDAITVVLHHAEDGGSSGAQYSALSTSSSCVFGVMIYVYSPPDVGSWMSLLADSG